MVILVLLSHPSKQRRTHWWYTIQCSTSITTVSVQTVNRSTLYIYHTVGVGRNMWGHCLLGRQHSECFRSECTRTAPHLLTALSCFNCSGPVRDHPDTSDTQEKIFFKKIIRLLKAHICLECCIRLFNKPVHCQKHQQCHYFTYQITV